MSAVYIHAHTYTHRALGMIFKIVESLVAQESNIIIDQRLILPGTRAYYRAERAQL